MSGYIIHITGIRIIYCVLVGWFVQLIKGTES